MKRKLPKIKQEKQNQSNPQRIQHLICKRIQMQTLNYKSNFAILYKVIDSNVANAEPIIP